MHFRDLAVGPEPQLPRDAYQHRRDRLAQLLGPRHLAILATHPVRQYSHDVDYPFRPHSDFWYLTGFAEPHAVLVLQGGSGTTTLFMQPRKKEAEIWTGRRLGAERAPEVLGVDAAFPAAELPGRLAALVKGQTVHLLADGHPTLLRRLRALGTRLAPEPAAPRPGGNARGRKAPPSGTREADVWPVRQVRQVRQVRHARTLLHEMRLVKEPAEMRMLRKACDLGVASHLAARELVQPGNPEYQVEAAFDHHARHHGSTGVGYPSICGCGANSAVLHYISNLDRLQSGRTFLIDAGCEWGYYTSDITRTYGVGGFTRLQEDLFGIVERAHRAGIAKVRPGAPFRAPHEAAVAEITQGLLDLKLLSGSFEKALAERSYTKYFMHGTSHFLGLDVHDAGAATEPDGSPRLLRENMVLTVEPGLYFNPEFAPECPPAARGIGIRIEDDIQVVAGGRRNLTRHLPLRIA